MITTDGFQKARRFAEVFFGLFLTFPLRRVIICGQAGVLELADEEDSKSFGLITRAGSTPATGTNKGATPSGVAPFLVPTPLRVEPAVFTPHRGVNTKLPPSYPASVLNPSGGNSG